MESHGSFLSHNTTQSPKKEKRVANSDGQVKPEAKDKPQKSRMGVAKK
jgi:hypothetical protein